MSNKGSQIMTDSGPAVAAAMGLRNYIITVNNHSYNVSVTAVDSIQNLPVTVSEAGGIKAATNAPAAVTAVQGVEAPTPGNIVKILVDIGTSVTVDQPLVVIEAMKMESEVNSPCAGKVHTIHIATGDVVKAGDMLLNIGR